MYSGWVPNIGSDYQELLFKMAYHLVILAIFFDWKKSFIWEIWSYLGSNQAPFSHFANEFSLKGLIWDDEVLYVSAQK